MDPPPHSPPSTPTSTTSDVARTITHSVMLFQVETQVADPQVKKQTNKQTNKQIHTKKEKEKKKKTGGGFHEHLDKLSSQLFTQHNTTQHISKLNEVKTINNQYISIFKLYLFTVSHKLFLTY